MLTKQKKELLFCGYIRSNYTQYDKISVDVLLSFIEWYSNALINVEIKGDDLQKFRDLSETAGKSFATYNIKLSDDISLECHH